MASNFGYVALIVIPADKQSTGNQHWSPNIDSDGGNNTFRVPLSSDGLTTTHYWAHGVFTLGMLDSLKTFIENNTDAFLVILENEFGVHSEVTDRFTGIATIAQPDPNNDLIDLGLSLFSILEPTDP